MDNRTQLLTALVGSYNYNLNDESSDKDWKRFVAPTFDDLYDGNMYSKAIIGEDCDVDIHDIRKLPQLFWKSNINFLEILFSTEYGFIDDRLNQLFALKDYIVKMNLPYLYNACKGMYFNKMKYLDKGTSGTIHLVEKFGYDTKQALHAYRVLDFITRYAFTDFKDFQWALTYNGTHRDFMLDIKHGKFTIEQFITTVNHKLSHFQKFESIYQKQKLNLELYEHLISVIKNLVKEVL